MALIYTYIVRLDRLAGTGRIQPEERSWEPERRLKRARSMRAHTAANGE